MAVQEKFREIWEVLDVNANEFRNHVKSVSPQKLNQLERGAQDGIRGGTVTTTLGGAGLVTGIFVEKFLTSHLPENSSLKTAVKVGSRIVDIGSILLAGLGILARAASVQERNIVQQERISRV